MTRKTVQGVLKTWKEDRGFGFIKPDDGSKDIFMHISALDSSSRRPVTGDIIHYQVTRDHRGKFKAINAQIEGVVLSKTATANTEKTGINKIILIGLVLTGVAAVSAAIFWFLSHQSTI